jgi:hypothetical protein
VGSKLGTTPNIAYGKQTGYYTEYSIYCGFINTVGLYIRLSYFHPFQ